MKRVLVTGGAGFIAHHLIDTIIQTTDWEIVTLDRLDFSGSYNRLHDILKDYTPEQKKRVKIVFHDLKASINPLTDKKIGVIDYVFHLAAGSHVDRSIDFPMEFVQDNVIGTVNLLDWARTRLAIQKFVYFSTDEVFGPAPNGIKYKEHDRYNSTNPYSATKAAAEELCVAYHNTYGVPVIITHTMNVFGERQHPEKFIPMTIRKVSLGEEVTIHSDVTRTIPGSRHYIHAKDVSDGLMYIIHNLSDYRVKDEYGGAKCPKFNLVGPEETDNLTLAKLVASAQGKELKYKLVDFHSSRPGHDLRYALDGGLMKELGWEPKIKFSERIKEVVKWTLENEVNR